MDESAPFLHLLKAEPSLLPIAPDDAGALHIEHRRNDEVHDCLRCGKRADCAYICSDPDGRWNGNRWLDLCWDCDHWLRSNIDNNPPINEYEALARLIDNE